MDEVFEIDVQFQTALQNLSFYFLLIRYAYFCIIFIFRAFVSASSNRGAILVAVFEPVDTNNVEKARYELVS